MAFLHSLAPELLVLINQALDSPRDLYALTAASPVCLRIFNSHRVSILTSVLANSIEPAALHHALAISHAPPTGYSSQGLHSQASRAHLPQSFLDRYFCGSFEFPPDVHQLTALCRLQVLVSRFSKDYFLSATRLVQAPPTSEAVSIHSTPLSPTERARLQRAFFRYELATRLFPLVPGTRRTSVFSAREQFRYFLGRMEGWEVEEMSCIHNYLTSLVRDAFVSLEDRLVRRVLMSAGLKDEDDVRASFSGTETFLGPIDGSVPPESDDSVAVDRKSKVDRSAKLVPFTDLELHGLPLFETLRKRSVPPFISNVASHGLEHMARLLDGDDEEQKNMIQEHAPFSRDFLAEALRHTPRRDSGDPPPPYTEEDVLDDSPCHPNLGYVLFSRKPPGVHHGIYNHHRDLVYNPLREGGYVFWDSARVKIPAVREYLERASKITRETMLSRSWSNRESVEERLRGVRITWSEMRRIIREFTPPCQRSESGSGSNDEVGSS